MFIIILDVFRLNGFLNFSYFFYFVDWELKFLYVLFKGWFILFNFFYELLFWFLKVMDIYEIRVFRNKLYLFFSFFVLIFCIFFNGIWLNFFIIICFRCIIVYYNKYN